MSCPFIVRMFCQCSQATSEHPGRVYGTNSVTNLGIRRIEYIVDNTAQNGQECWEKASDVEDVMKFLNLFILSLVRATQLVKAGVLPFQVSKPNLQIVLRSTLRDAATKPQVRLSLSERYAMLRVVSGHQLHQIQAGQASALPHAGIPTIANHPMRDPIGCYKVEHPK